MYKLSFKDRIALYNLVGVAILILFIFIGVYITVAISVNYEVNRQLRRKGEIHQKKIAEINGKIGITNPNEWEQSEHKTLFMNPVFVQIFDRKKQSVDKSPNLGDENLLLRTGVSSEQFLDTIVNSVPVRQTQIKVEEKGKFIGYVVVAMSVQSQYKILYYLQYILVFTYIIFLIILFFLTRFIAGRSIRPALSIMEMTKNINANNLKERVVLPSNQDELYILSENINGLLDSVENAVSKEKQFTSDASHELRTPLTIIQTTLELLLRKPRDSEEYIHKINSCMEEITRVNELISQLLILARFESPGKNFKSEAIEINEAIMQVVARNEVAIKDKGILVTTSFDGDYFVLSENSMLSIVLENIISNAIKYSRENGKIDISIKKNGELITCIIADDGIGIRKNDIEKVYDQFFRSEASNHEHIKGNGLGLSIVKKIAALLKITIHINSVKNEGTSFVLELIEFKDVQ